MLFFNRRAKVKALPKAGKHNIELMNAIAANDLHRVGDLLCAGADPNCSVENGHTPLEITGDVLIIKSLIGAGARPQEALMQCCIDDNNTKCAIIIDTMSGLNRFPDEDWLLAELVETAIEHESMDTATMLLQNPVIKKAAQNNTLCIMKAAVKNNSAYIKLLERNGIKPNDKDECQHMLAAALKYNRQDSLNYLTQAGYKINPAHQNFINLLEEAVDDDDAELTACLLDLGVNPNHTEEDSVSLVHKAVDRTYDILQKLLQAGADPDHGGDNHSAPLIKALLQDDSTAVEMLLAAGANPNVYDSDGESALSIACRRETAHKDIALLLKAGANPDDGGEDCRPPLIHAITHSDGRLVKILLEAGASPDARDTDSEPAINMACKIGRNGKKGILVQLLNAGADLDIEYRKKPFFSYHGDNYSSSSVMTMLDNHYYNKKNWIKSDDQEVMRRYKTGHGSAIAETFNFAAQERTRVIQHPNDQYETHITPFYKIGQDQLQQAWQALNKDKAPVTCPPGPGTAPAHMPPSKPVKTANGPKQSTPGKGRKLPL